MNNEPDNQESTALTRRRFLAQAGASALSLAVGTPALVVLLVFNGSAHLSRNPATVAATPNGRHLSFTNLRRARKGETRHAKKKAAFCKDW